MKKIILILCIAASVCKTSAIYAQVNVQDSLALVDLYDSCHTSDFSLIENNWLSGPVKTWGGVELTGDRVTSLIINGYQDKEGNNYIPLANHLPASIGNLKKLKTLNLFFNELTGTIPTSLLNLDKLEILNLAQNSFNKPVPNSFEGLTSLSTLDLEADFLGGSIPSSIGSLGNLSILQLSLCHLTGAIPSSFGNLLKLTSLNLSDNNLDQIPSSLGLLSNLQVLVLGTNQFSGNIPSCIFQLTNLIGLDLSNNKLSGKIPDSIGVFTNLTNLTLEGNKFSGKLPETIGNLTHLKYLEVYGNKITGVPESIKYLKALYELDLRENKLSSMPSSFAALKFFAGVPYVYIEFNQLNFDFIQQVVNIRDTGFFGYTSQAQLMLHSQDSVLSVYAGGTLGKNTYHWYKNNELIATITGDSTYSISGAGAYNVTVTNKIARALTLYSDTITISGFANAEAKKVLADQSSISLFPNPVKDILNFSLADNSGKAVVLIYDNNGKIILQNEQTVISGNNISINTAKLTAGSYFIHVLMNGKEFTKQFVKE